MGCLAGCTGVLSGYLSATSSTTEVFVQPMSVPPPRRCDVSVGHLTTTPSRWAPCPPGHLCLRYFLLAISAMLRPRLGFTLCYTPAPEALPSTLGVSPLLRLSWHSSHLTVKLPAHTMAIADSCRLNCALQHGLPSGLQAGLPRVRTSALPHARRVYNTTLTHVGLYLSCRLTQALLTSPGFVLLGPQSCPWLPSDPASPRSPLLSARGCTGHLLTGLSR